MERSVKQVIFPAAKLPGPKRVAAYARVSSGKDAMLHSLSAQVSYYSDLIQHTPGWKYVGVYADEAMTGTKDSRENFQRLLRDCEAGLIDMVITKSISRMARNTVTLLETVRSLKEIGVDVFFEEQSIHTMSADGELMLTILASYAQEESLSASENQKWRVRKNFEEGKPWNGTMLGYRYHKGTLVVVPEEAETVRRIYSDYLSGLGAVAIMKKLNTDGIPSRFGNAWNKSGVMSVLRNYTYTGNLLLQTTFSENHLTKRKMANNGQHPQYHVEGSHEPIIDISTYNSVQLEIAKRAKKHTHPGQKKNTYPFTGKLVCTGCGKHYRRKVTKARPVWICSTFNTMGKALCLSKQIPEETLYHMAAEALGMDVFSEEAFFGKITAVRVKKDNILVFCFKDRTETVKRWQDRSRRESWTEEMKEAPRQKNRERRLGHGQ